VNSYGLVLFMVTSPSALMGMCYLNSNHMVVIVKLQMWMRGTDAAQSFAGPSRAKPGYPPCFSR